MAKQDQSVGDAAKGYQAGGNLTVHEGLAPDDMMALMVAMAKQLSAYTEEANAKLNERFKEFREEVVNQFADEAKANRGAFNDPDFQFTVQAAQEEYAKKGDAGLKEELVRLLAERSRVPTGTRVANILNQAIKTAGSLSASELSILVVNFVMINLSMSSPSQSEVARSYSGLLSPFIINCTDNENAFEYLESLGCVTINRLIGRNTDAIIVDKFRLQYPGVDSPEAIKASLSQFPVLAETFSVWDYNTRLQQSHLTTLGKALAHSALVSRVGLDAPLEIWVS